MQTLPTLRISVELLHSSLVAQSHIIEGLNAAQKSSWETKRATARLTIKNR